MLSYQLDQVHRMTSYQWCRFHLENTSLYAPLFLLWLSQVLTRTKGALSFCHLVMSSRQWMCQLTEWMCGWIILTETWSVFDHLRKRESSFSPCCVENVVCGIDYAVSISMIFLLQFSVNGITPVHIKKKENMFCIKLSQFLFLIIVETHTQQLRIKYAWFMWLLECCWMKVLLLLTDTFGCLRIFHWPVA